MRSLLTVIAILVCILPAELDAQSGLAFVQPGIRVRVTAPSLSSTRLVGEALPARGDTLILRLGTAGETLIPASQMTLLEVSRGYHGHGTKGAAIGSLIGVIGGLAGAWPGLERDDHVLNGTVGGVAGLVVGAVVGLVYRTERWELVPFAGSTR